MIKEVESILFSLSLILAIASKVFSLAGLTRKASQAGPLEDSERLSKYFKSQEVLLLGPF